MNGGKIAGIVLAAGGIAAIVWGWRAGLFGGTAASAIPGLTAQISYVATPAAAS